MIWIDDVVALDYELEVFECGCGFHLGLDASYLDQVGDIVIQCPACNESAVIEAFDGD